ncbi:MAG: FtsQ-type POTRA domain-containing protein [Clostridia bacterium]|nr:FtsQ-type POTRA domain-containing protein [Clostridia bacterium]
MRRSKAVIGIFVALILVVLTIVLLAFTVFIVRDVEVEAAVSSHLIDAEKIIESSELSRGDSIISINKSKVIANIEKDNPYVEITNVVRDFPSKVVIYATIRTGIMMVPSEDGSIAAIIDSSAKVLNVVSSLEAEKAGVTSVKGVSFKVPEEGALSLIGSTVSFTNESCGTMLRNIATAAADPALDIAGTGFRTFFKSIEFVTGEGITAYVKTNKGVTLVLDSTLSTSIYQQLYLCMYVYASEDTGVDRTRGYIVLDRDSELTAYKWVESLSDPA